MGREGKKNRKFYKKKIDRLRFSLIIVGKTRGETNIEILSPEMIRTEAHVDSKENAESPQVWGQKLG